MNYLMASIGANVTLSLVSAATAATNSTYTLINNISNSTSTGAENIKRLIKKRDLEMKIKMTQFLLLEIKIDDNTPITLHCCISSINKAIKNISCELDKIKYRIEYNENLWVGISLRSYNFANCQLRLESNIDTLESRYMSLMNILIIQDKMYKNKNLVELLSESVMIVDVIDKNSVKKIKDSIHEKLTFVGT